MVGVSFPQPIKIQTELLTLLKCMRRHALFGFMYAPQIGVDKTQHDTTYVELIKLACILSSVIPYCVAFFSQIFEQTETTTQPFKSCQISGCLPFRTVTALSVFGGGVFLFRQLSTNQAATCIRHKTGNNPPTVARIETSSLSIISQLNVKDFVAITRCLCCHRPAHCTFNFKWRFLQSHMSIK